MCEKYQTSKAPSFIADFAKFEVEGLKLSLEKNPEVFLKIIFRESIRDLGKNGIITESPVNLIFLLVTSKVGI